MITENLNIKELILSFFYIYNFDEFETFLEYAFVLVTNQVRRICYCAETIKSDHIAEKHAIPR